MADDLDVVMGPARQDDAEEMVVVTAHHRTSEQEIAVARELRGFLEGAGFGRRPCYLRFILPKMLALFVHINVH
jgi:hypothetical protein